MYKKLTSLGTEKFPSEKISAEESAEISRVINSYLFTLINFLIPKHLKTIDQVDKKCLLETAELINKLRFFKNAVKFNRSLEASAANKFFKLITTEIDHLSPDKKERAYTKIHHLANSIIDLTNKYIYIEKLLKENNLDRAIFLDELQHNIINGIDAVDGWIVALAKIEVINTKTDKLISQEKKVKEFLIDLNKDNSNDYKERPLEQKAWFWQAYLSKNQNTTSKPNQLF